jgi:hypothetical protein
MATATRTTEYQLPSESGGIPRMEDAEPASEPEIACYTPRPGDGLISQYSNEEKHRRITEIKEWRDRFTAEANISARKAKLRRSANSRTFYTPGSHPNLKTCMDSKIQGCWRFN